MPAQERPELCVALAGFGAIGGTLAKRLDQGVAGLRLAAVSAHDHEGARARMSALSAPVPILPLAALAEQADVVVECAPPPVFREVAEPAIGAGRIFMPASVGQLLEHEDLIGLAKRRGARIMVPTGAILGLDAVRAAAEGTVESVTMVTRKPPRGLAGAPHIEREGIDLDAVQEPLKVFDGSAREGARGFPANVNVAAALSLAGIGPDRTRLEVWADPTVTRNTHRIVVEADSARFEMMIENIPSEANPRTGKITALSMIAALAALNAPLKVGS
ncbi:MAG: aspartate dehydrogenase [Pseudomonadota bacterium]